MFARSQLKPWYIDVVDFIERNKAQIAMKSRAYFWMSAMDLENEIAVFLLQKGNQYDPARGSPEEFVFGSVEKMLRRGKTDPLSYPQSIDSECREGLALRNALEENQLPFAEVIHDGDEPEKQSMTPSKHAALEIANAVSGLDNHDIAKRLSVGTRRVRQLINETIENCRREQHEKLLKNKLLTLVDERVA